MKLSRIRIHNFRSIIDADIEAHDFLLLVGANNAGKSNVINALRCFYDNLTWTDDDFPKINNEVKDQDSWVELSFTLSDNEWENLSNDYKKGVSDKSMVLRRFFRGDKFKPRQSNIHAVINGNIEENFFYGAKQVSAAKCGDLIYIPALTTPGEQMKTTGPSPLRNMLNFMLKKVVSKSPAYAQLEKAFDGLNEEAKSDAGFLSEIANPINAAINQWRVKIDLSVNKISPEEINKTLVKCAFTDTVLGDTSFELERFGHGFQRSVIYELIRMSPGFHEENVATKKEFDPQFTLILFEEPEAFLHPAQQENMAFHLRELGKDDGSQVIVTSHSPIFAGKSTNDFGQICRIQKSETGISAIYQLKQYDAGKFFNAGNDLQAELQKYVDDPNVAEFEKTKAKKLVENLPTDEIASQYEKFRFQLWLDSDRASMFFADKVILVEGATEKALFNYLLSNEWHSLSKERIFVVDALGKYNFHRFIKLFSVYGINHGIIFDNDCDKNEQKVINKFIRNQKTEFTLSEPFEFNECLEKYLGLSIPERGDQKPIQILKTLHDKTIKEEKLNELKIAFTETLAIKS